MSLDSVPSTAPSTVSPSGALGDRLTLRDPDSRLEFELAAGVPDPAFDAFLRARGAATWVFLPYFAPLRDGPERPPLDRAALEKKTDHLATQLEGDAFLEGELTTPLEERVPGVFVLGLRRARARELARDLGLEEVFWGAVGESFGSYPVKLADDADDDDDSIVEKGRSGLAGMRVALGELVRAPHSYHAAGPGARPLLWCVLGLLALAWLGHVAAALDASDVLSADAEQGARNLLHPVFVTLVVGVYLRRRLPALTAERPARELTHAEAERAWSRFAPHLVAVWVVASLGVVAVASARLWSPAAELDDLLEDTTYYLVASLWTLPAIAYSRDWAKAFEGLIEALIAVALSMLSMKLTLLFTGMGARILLSIVGAFVSFDLPEWLEGTTEVVLDVAGALGFLYLMLGYTWSKQRDSFVQWASGEYRT